MAWIETLCAKCGRTYQTDLTTLSDKEEGNYASERQRAVAAAGSHWRLCQDCIRRMAKDMIPLNLKIDELFEEFYSAVQHPDEKAALMKKLEPGDLIDDEAESSVNMTDGHMLPNQGASDDEIFEFKSLNHETGVWQSVRFKHSDG